MVWTASHLADGSPSLTRQRSQSDSEGDENTGKVDIPLVSSHRIKPADEIKISMIESNGNGSALYPERQPRKKDVATKTNHMCAPIDRARPPLAQIITKTNEFRVLLDEENYDEFNQKFFDAVKTDDIDAVKKILAVVKEMKIDLCHDQFQESVYTASILHVALSFQADQVVDLLIKGHPMLITTVYTSEKFKDQTAYHIAVANGQLDVMKHMGTALQKLGKEDEHIRLLNTLAVGDYFKETHPEGALTLTVAAYNGHVELFKWLIENGADLEKRGHGSNTVLHHIIALSSSYPDSPVPQELFDIVKETSPIYYRRKLGQPTQFHSDIQRSRVRAQALQKLFSIKNDAGRTPLSLAVNLCSHLTTSILHTKDVYKQPQSKCGSMSWATYDVTEVVSFPPGERTNRYDPGSVLHILSHRASLKGDGSYRDLIQEEPIISLVKMKWDVYFWIFMLWFLTHLATMAGITATALHYQVPALNTVNKTVVIQRLSNDNHTMIKIDQAKEVIERKIHPWLSVFFVPPIVSLLLTVMFLGTTVRSCSALDTGIDKGTLNKWTSFIKRFGIQVSSNNTPFEILEVLFSVSTIIWVIMHLCQYEYQDVPLSLALVFGWPLMLLFTRCFLPLSRFSYMLQRMFFHDSLHFLCVFLCFWLAFSASLHVLLVYGGTEDHFGTTMYRMLNIVTEAGDGAEADGATVPFLAKSLLTVYAILSVILLVNMLIAMMGSSYEAFRDSKVNIWRYQQLSISLLLERRFWFWKWLCKKSQGATFEKPVEDGKVKRVFLYITEQSILRRGVSR